MDSSASSSHGAVASSSEASVEVEQHQQRKHPVPPLPDGVPGDTAAVKVEGGGDEEDDEQVEKFFALLANIRALRRMYGASFAGDGAADRGRKKRAREAEPPWRPAFRLEDFQTQEEEQPAGKKKMMVEGTGGARLPAGTSTGAVDEDDGEVVEPSGRPVAGRVARRG